MCGPAVCGVADEGHHEHTFEADETCQILANNGHWHGGRLPVRLDPSRPPPLDPRGVFAAADDQGPEVRFCGYVPTHHRKQTTEQSFGQPWKLCRDSGCQNWQSSPTRTTCSWERLAGPSTGSQRDGQPHLENCKFTSQSGKCCSVKWRRREEKSGGNMSQHMSTCRETRWRMDWPWKACVQAHCGHSMLHQNHHQGQSPR